MATGPPLAGSSADGVENKAPLPFRENLNIHLICPDCRINPPDLVEDNADTICANCGRVLAERLISYESEWRTFNSDEKGGDDPNRVGDTENELLYGNAGTVIGGGGPNVSKQSRILRNAQQHQNEDKNNRALQKAYTILDGWADAEHLTTTTKTLAKSNYKKVYEKTQFRAKDQSAVLAGCLFIACRLTDVERTFAELMNLTRVAKKDIGRTFKLLNKFFREESEKERKAAEDRNEVYKPDANVQTPQKTSKAHDHVGRFCGMLGLPFRVRVIALALTPKIDNIPSLAGRSPLSNAGVCIYFAATLLGYPISLQDVATVSNVSETTLKQAVKELYKNRDTVLEKDWLGPQPQSLKDTSKVVLNGDIANLAKLA